MMILVGKEEFFSEDLSSLSRAFWPFFAEANLCKELGPPYFDIMGGHMRTSRGPAGGRQEVPHEELQEAEIAYVETFCMRMSMRSACS